MLTLLFIVENLIENLARRFWKEQVLSFMGSVHHSLLAKMISPLLFQRKELITVRQHNSFIIIIHSATIQFCFVLVVSIMK